MLSRKTIKTPLRISLLCLCTAFAVQGRADTLQQVYQLAQKEDAQIGEARARYAADHTQLNQARARMLPQVTLSAQRARNAQGPVAVYSYDNGYITKGWGLNLSENLLDMQLWYNWQSAKAGDQRAAVTLTQAEQDLIMRVAKAYFDVLRSQENLAAFEAEQAATQSVLEQTQQKYDVGLAAVTDLNEAQAGYDLARVNTLREQRTLAQRRLVLENITGHEHGELARLKDDFPVQGDSSASADDWVATATDNSPAVRIAELDYDSRKSDVKAARSAMLPTLSVSANYNYTGASQNPYSFIPFSASKSTVLRLNFSMPLFTGGANWYKERQAYHLRDMSEQSLVRVERDTERTVRDNYLGVEMDVQAVKARNQAVISAQTAYEAAEAGAEIGTRNIVDVLQAQRQLFQAQRDHANARYDYVMDSLSLKQAAGVLSPDDISSLSEWLE